MLRNLIAQIREGAPPLNSVTVLLLFVWTLIFYETLQVLAIQRVPPAHIYEENVLGSDNVSRSDYLRVQVKLVRHKPCTIVVTWYLQDDKGNRAYLAPSVVQAQRTGYEEYTRQFVIPDTIENGPATLHVSSVYSCHWSHLIWPVVVSRTHHFSIVE
jgi:hypothetical protein